MEVASALRLDRSLAFLISGFLWALTVVFQAFLSVAESSSACDVWMGESRSVCMVCALLLARSRLDSSTLEKTRSMSSCSSSHRLVPALHPRDLPLSRRRSPSQIHHLSSPQPRRMASWAAPARSRCPRVANGMSNPASNCRCRCEFGTAVS